jgi:hypothetical protein
MVNGALVPSPKLTPLVCDPTTGSPRSVPLPVVSWKAIVPVSAGSPATPTTLFTVAVNPNAPVVVLLTVMVVVVVFAFPDCDGETVSFTAAEVLAAYAGDAFGVPTNTAR